MGLAKRNLYLTRLGEHEQELYLSADYKPVFKPNGTYVYNNEMPFGYDLFCPNVMPKLTYFDGSVPVKVVRSEKETGLWVACINDYFGDEQHLFNYKPKYREDALDRVEYDKDGDFDLHVYTDFEMHSGEGPYPVTLVLRKEGE